MSGSDPGKRTSAVEWVFPTIGIVGAVTLAWAFGHLEGAESERRHNAPRAYEQSAEQDAKRACVGGEPGAVFECVNEHVKAAREAAHDEQDLSAQQRAAASALAAALVALLTLIVSGIGVWFVKRTLDATLEAVEDTSEATRAMREANEITEAHARIQLRAYLAIASVEVKTLTDTTAVIQLTVRNYGSTPASDIVVFCDAFGDIHPLKDAHLKHTPARRHNAKPWIAAGGSDTITVYATGKFDRKALVSLSAAVSLYVYGRFEYLDVFKRPQWANFCYRNTVGEPAPDWLVVHPQGNDAT